MAAALLGGGGLGLGYQDFSNEAAADPRRLALASRVRCVADSRADQIFPMQLPAVLRVLTTGGHRHEVRVDANRGGPGNPLTSDELTAMFMANVGGHMTETEGRDVAELALGLANSDLPDLPIPRTRAPLPLSGAQSGGSYSLIKIISPRGGGPGLHVHNAAEEHFVVLKGEVDFEVGGERSMAGTGDVVHVPRGVAHAFTVRGVQATTLATHTPAGEEEAFMALAVLVTE